MGWVGVLAREARGRRRRPIGRRALGALHTGRRGSATEMEPLMSEASPSELSASESVSSSPRSGPDPSGTTLPGVPRPQGAYVPAVRYPCGPDAFLIFSAGMTPRRDGVMTVTGLVGREVDRETAAQAAGLAATNALAAIADAAGGPANVRALLQVNVFVACADGFTELSAVADGASAALSRALPACAGHARTTIGVRALPGGAPVEVDVTAVAARTTETGNERA